MSAPAAAAAASASSSGSKRTRPDPVALLWSELKMLEDSVVSDLRLWGTADPQGTERRRKGLSQLKSVNGTQGWASTAAIAEAVEIMDASFRLDNGHRWCEDARVRLGTIRLLLQAQEAVHEAKKAKEKPDTEPAPALKPVVQFVHIHLGNDDFPDSVWTLPVYGAHQCDLEYVKASYKACHTDPNRKPGCLAAMFGAHHREELLDCSVGTSAVDNEVVVWRVPIYHDHRAPNEEGAYPACMLCKE